jgi:hypothetical protein
LGRNDKSCMEGRMKRARGKALRRKRMVSCREALGREHDMTSLAEMPLPGVRAFPCQVARSQARNKEAEAALEAWRLNEGRLLERLEEHRGRANEAEAKLQECIGLLQQHEDQVGGCWGWCL